MTRPPSPRLFTVLLLLGVLMLCAAITASGLPMVAGETNSTFADPGDDGETSPETTDTPLPDDGNSSPEGAANQGLRVQSDFPARTIEAGETAIFVLNVENRGAEEKVRRLRATLPSRTAGWEYRFTDEDRREVSMIDIPQGGQRSVRFEVETAAETEPGQYPMSVHVGERSYPLYVTISRSHAGDRARLRLVVNDKDGNAVRRAEIDLLSPGRATAVDRVMTAADGTVDLEVTPGTYDVRVGREGYAVVTRAGVRLKGGVVTDLGTVTLEPRPYAAEVRLETSSVIGTAGRNAQFEMELRNIGRTEDVYRLGSEDVPQDWYVRFRDRDGNSAELDEVALAPGEGRRLTIEAIPSRNAVPGTYNLTATVLGGGGTYARNLTVRMQGATEMRVTAERYQYDITRGDALEFNITVRNGGTTGALTNLNASISAPQGWSAVLTPQGIGSVPPGDTAAIRARVIPPASIPASEYRFSVRVVADQAEKTDEYRVIVHEQSLVPLLGVLMLAVIAGGTWFLFRRYRRR
ncbi:NPCBM-associated, NEW3 domain of alpha-galactosidase [anaerobic digester metagenome]